MSASIVYGGNDFGEFTRAEVLYFAASPVDVEAAAVLGGYGACLMGGTVAPKTVRVRLYLVSDYKMDDAAAADIRRTIAGWLARPMGATLILPDEPGIEYRDAVVTRAGIWSRRSADAYADVEFTVYDAAGYGRRILERTASFIVGGSAPTLPIITVSAQAGTWIDVALLGTENELTIQGNFTQGQSVELDFERMTAYYGGEYHFGCAAMGGNWFALRPGPVELRLLHCSLVRVEYTERWA